MEVGSGQREESIGGQPFISLSPEKDIWDRGKLAPGRAYGLNERGDGLEGEAFLEGGAKMTKRLYETQDIGRGASLSTGAEEYACSNASLL
jgi:hypothetical protein